MASKNGTLRKIKKGKYQAIWQLEKSQAEQLGQNDLTKIVNTKNDGLEWLSIQKALYGDSSSNNPFLTLKIIYNESYFVNRIEKVKLNILKSSTVDRENQVFRTHLENSELGNTPLKDLKSDTINQFLSNKLLIDNYSHSEVYKHLYGLIVALLKYAYSREWIKKPLYEQIYKAPKNIKPPKEIKPFTKAEINKLYETSQDLWNNKKQGRTNLCYLLLAYTGMRVGELLDLRWEEIYFDKREIVIDSTYSYQKDFTTGKRSFTSGTPKTKASNRIIGLNDNALTILLQIKQRNLEQGLSSKYILCNNEGGQLDRSTFRETVKRLFKASGIPIPNDLLHLPRHFYISVLRKMGISEYDIATMVGHSDTASTKPYLHTNTNQVAKKMKDLNIGLGEMPCKSFTKTTDFNSKEIEKAIESHSKKPAKGNGKIINLSDYFTA
ncbi:MAG: tyrosine-type recombinase/integrase [Lachnospirales bacterium]